MRLLGQYSYAMYVFHIPVQEVATPLLRRYVNHLTASVRVSDFMVFLLLCLICYALAYCSWHLYEKQFIRMKRYFPQPRLLQILDDPQLTIKNSAAVASHPVLISMTWQHTEGQ